MAVPAPPVPQTAELPSAAAERAASRRGLGLLAVVAAVGALIFSIMLAGTGSTPQALSTPSETALNAPALEASGTVAVNARDADALASQLPGIGPVYAARSRPRPHVLRPATIPLPTSVRWAFQATRSNACCR